MQSKSQRKELPFSPTGAFDARVNEMKATRPDAFFTADAISLDFANTFSTPAGRATDWLCDGEDLLAWITASELVEQAVLDELKRITVAGELDAVAAQARALRDWFRAFVIKHKGKPLRGAALGELEPLNRLLARDDEFWQITAAGRGAKTALAMTPKRRWRSADALLFPLASSMADLICEEDFRHVHMCEGIECTLLFIDRTRSKGRRWCSMSLCGNRAKQAAHRARQKS